jgi:hypothetical protein
MFIFPARSYVRAFTLTDEIRQLTEIKDYIDKRIFIDIDYQYFGRKKMKKSCISAKQKLNNKKPDTNAGISIIKKVARRNP